MIYARFLELGILPNELNNLEIEDFNILAYSLELKNYEEKRGKIHFADEVNKR